MSTSLSSAAIPQFYRELFDDCSNDGEPIHLEVYNFLLANSNLPNSEVNTIRTLAGATEGLINRTCLYKTLALIAWAQQERQLSDKLFENCAEKEYPKPEIKSLDRVHNLKEHLIKTRSDTAVINYNAIVQLDIINVHLVPEKKGLILKYSEYIITSKRFNSKVTRRYNDFVALKELLLNRFPYRLVPSLPPKKIMSDAHFLESRRRALHRWMTLISRHPVISQDPLLQFFLTDQGPDCQYRIKEIFRRAPDEFMTSDIAATAKNLLPPNYTQQAVNSQNIRTLVNVIGKLKQLAEDCVERQNVCSRQFEDFSAQMKILSTLDIGEGQSCISNWLDMQKGFNIMAKEIPNLVPKSNQQAAMEQNVVCERLGLLLDILVAHKQLCERLEKGLHNEHAAALSKLLSLKKRKIQGVIRGTDAESVEHLESKVLTQESVITNMELRTDFSLYCVHMETQLVYAYLGTLSYIMDSMINLKLRNHSEFYNTWKHIQDVAQNFFANNHQSNGIQS
nr:unnamed protein product [Callosobruchus analis]